MRSLLARPPDPSSHGEQGASIARVFGVLYLCGAVLVSLSLVLAHPPTSQTGPIFAIAGLAATAGMTLFLGAKYVRAWMLHAATAASTVMVCLVIYFSGVDGGVYSLMFVWIVVVQSYFFPGRVAFAQLAWLLVAYGVTLWVLGESFGYAPVTRWLLSVLTLVVAAVIGSWLVLGRRRAERRTRRFFDLSQDLLCTICRDGRFAALNPAWRRSLGYRRSDLQSERFLDLVHPEDHAVARRQTRRLFEGRETTPFEVRLRARDGSWRWLTWSGALDEEEDLIYARATDVTERMRLEREREKLLTEVGELAHTDPLTGLPNRRALDDVLGREMARALRLDSPLCVAMIDLDHFKRFNDLNGHAAGDGLLRDAAARWRDALRTSDFIARYGGEEFVVVLPDCAPPAAETVLDRLRSAVPRDETCSVGLACWNFRSSPEQFLAVADTALYRAKSAGRDRLMVAA